MIGIFARHPTAANLLMIMMLLAGVISITRQNTQFFPDFSIEFVTVVVVWPGASASDAEANIVEALEPELRQIDDVKNVLGTAKEGVGTIAVEFYPDADMQAGLSAVETAVAQVTTLPEDAEQPVIKRIVFYDTVSRILVSGPFPEASLKVIAKRFKEDLLARGIDKVTLFGARDEEIIVEVDQATLMRLDLTLADIAKVIGESSQDMPSGDTTGANEIQIRSIGLKTDAAGLRDIEIAARDSGERILLRDIATVRDGFDHGQPVGVRGGERAIELHIQRSVGNDALELAETVNAYIAEIQPTLPPTLRVEMYDVAASLIQERINLLLRNGLGGLVLVLGVLFLFLNARVAIWVAVGIPVALMAAMAVMLATGQSINMVSLFALIMMLGIIVDDAIVVGEHAMARRLGGAGPLESAENGARRMLPPVTAASLTTIAAFVPVMLVSGEMGEILAAIPLVAIAVLVASLIECFLVLPGHLRGALVRPPEEASGFRRAINTRFDRMRDGPFRRLVALAVQWRYTTMALAVAVLIVSVGLVMGGRLQFVFFPSPEGDIMQADFSFAPGTPAARSQEMIDELERALAEADAKLTGADGDSVVDLTAGKIGASVSQAGAAQQATGDHRGGVHVELKPSEHRSVRTPDMITAWRAEIDDLPGLETLTIRERQGGPPGRDLDIRLSGGSVETLKKASLETRDLLTGYGGVSDVNDDLPWGKNELVLEVTPRGRTLGFTTESVGRQVRNAFEGAIAKRFPRGDEEVVVRVQYPRGTVAAHSLRDLYLRSPTGAEVPLSEVASLREDRGFAIIRREDGVREVAITAEIDEAVTNPTELVASLSDGPLAEIADRYEVGYRFAGKAEEQGETFADMGLGAMIGFSAIYLILAWVFASYTRPIVVMAIIPFGFIGAAFGHLLLGFDLSLLSIIGLLGLSGIVVNDSIILVSTIDERLSAGEDVFEAIIQGACDRFRAVLLTSLTTIGGLLPLLSETSLQAQFLKPMALTIVFGLLASTFLVLFVVPSLIAIQADFRRLVSSTPKARQEQHEHREKLEAAE
jgi:multidrug efflux pump subunit AcrB